MNNETHTGQAYYWDFNTRQLVPMAGSQVVVSGTGVTGLPVTVDPATGNMVVTTTVSDSTVGWVPTSGHFENFDPNWSSNFDKSKTVLMNYEQDMQEKHIWLQLYDKQIMSRETLFEKLDIDYDAELEYIRLEVDAAKKTGMLGDKPASDADIAEIQKQMSQMANDPNMTMVLDHIIPYNMMGDCERSVGTRNISALEAIQREEDAKIFADINACAGIGYNGSTTTGTTTTWYGPGCTHAGFSGTMGPVGMTGLSGTTGVVGFSGAAPERTMHSFEGTVCGRMEILE